MNYVGDVLTPSSVNASYARSIVLERWRPLDHPVHWISTCIFGMMSPTANVIGNTSFRKIVTQLNYIFSIQQHIKYIQYINM